jgi:phosphate transport system substrate-binding protein
LHLVTHLRRLLTYLPLALLAACAGDPPPPTPAHANDVLAPTPDAVLAMGSGAATPLLQALARAYGAGHPSLPVRVEPSVGSAGGIAAATDGAVDLGLVGRSLKPTEAKALEFLPLALDAVVLAAAVDVPRDGLSHEEVRRLYAGDRALGLTLLLRDPAETANAALEGAYPELRALREAGASSARFRVLDHDDAMAHALLTTPRAVGVFSFGAIQTWGLPLRPLALDGVQPGVSALAAKRWPAVRPVGVAFRTERRARVAPFLAFVASREGRAVTRAAGYLPLPEGEQ